MARKAKPRRRRGPTSAQRPKTSRAASASDTQAEKKVMLLGAGASKSAGYPLASELMGELEAWASTNANIVVRNHWQTWGEFHQSCEGLLRLLLDDPNPEIVLSVLDVCQVSSAAGIEGFRPDYREEAVGLSLAQDDVLPEQYFVTGHHQQAHRAAYARNALLRCLQAFFVDKHVDDLAPAGRRRRNYLRKLLASLKIGDVVITLNWDTTVERTLAEDGRWNPSDGFGFTKNLQTFEGKSLAFKHPSEVLVLKLHGSIGWHRSDRRGLYFSGADYLSMFEFPREGGGQLRVIDPAEDQLGYPAPPLLIHPSYMKDLGAPEIRQIWNKAEQALSKANAIEVWGYSLPESDQALRSLLANLRGRAERSEVSVTVYDPQFDTRGRWKMFLEKIVTVDSALG